MTLKHFRLVAVDEAGYVYRLRRDPDIAVAITRNGEHALVEPGTSIQMTPDEMLEAIQIHGAIKSGKFSVNVQPDGDDAAD